MPRPRSIANTLVRLLDSSPQPMYVVSEQRKIVYCNTALAQWVGLPAEEFAGARCDYHANEQENRVAEVAAGLCPPPESFLGKRMDGEIACVGPAGQLRLRTAEFSPLGNDALNCAGVLVMVAHEDMSESATPAGREETPAQLHERLWRMQREMGSRYQIDQLIGSDASIQRVRQQVQLAISGRPNVLIVGPPGSGREQVARTIHFHDREKTAGPLVPLSCPLLDAELLQATVTEFIHRCETQKDAGQGVLLLLDVDEMQAEAQREMSGFLQLPDFGLHLISTAARPLQMLVREELFEPDLAFALSTLEIELPSLAERSADIPLLAQYFLERCNARGERQLSGFAEQALDYLATHAWPGNLDELSQIVQQACRQAEGPLVTQADLPRKMHLAADAAAYPLGEQPQVVLDDVLAEVEAEVIRRALKQAKGNKAKAARLLGISRPRLLRRIEQLKIV